jgi:hypothetical protein
LACALGYLDFRYAHLAWRKTYPHTGVWFDRFGKRGSMESTRPPAA